MINAIEHYTSKDKCLTSQLPSHDKHICAFLFIISNVVQNDGFLKSVASAIAFSLSRLFKMSMDCGCIPQGWKQAIVCPIFKVPVNHLAIIVRFLLPDGVYCV